MLFLRLASMMIDNRVKTPPITSVPAGTRPFMRKRPTGEPVSYSRASMVWLGHRLPGSPILPELGPCSNVCQLCLWSVCLRLVDWPVLG